MANLLTIHPARAHPDLADEAVLMRAPDDVRVGAAGELLTDEALMKLYGVSLRSVTIGAAADRRPALAAVYEL